jgi:hypothetical protein
MDHTDRDDGPQELEGFNFGFLNHIEPSPAWYREERKREDDLRIKMFALDQAVTALPSIIQPEDDEIEKLRSIRYAAVQFEQYLRGE